MSKKRRSTTWIVTTHVLTTGLAIPTLIGMLCAATIMFLNVRNPLVALYMTVTFAVLGYVGGTLYSLSYLRKTTDSECWTRCTKPSIALFAILDIASCVWNVHALREQNAYSIGILVAGFLVGVVVFAVLTASGFAQMSPAVGAPGDAQESLKSATSSRQRGGRFGRRLRAAGVGFAVGVSAGLGISIYMDRGGWHPRNGWQLRLLTALVVGGIGALLGLVSGPPQK